MRIAQWRWRGQESGSDAMRLNLRLNFCQRLIFFLLSIHLISFHRFITLKEELEGQSRGKGAVEHSLRISN
jgi:hypothetical protein